MAPWVQTLINLAVLVTAVTVILAGIVALWKKIIRPGARLVTSVDEMLPLLKDLTAEFKNTPHAFAVLEEIVAQFRTDSGSSLRDVVNRLETAAEDSRKAVEVSTEEGRRDRQNLQVGLETARQLAQQDRAQLERLILLLDRLTIKVDAGSATSARIERSGVEVAMDLAAAHKRADTHNTAPAGTAADAAAQQTKKEEKQNRDT